MATSTDRPDKDNILAELEAMRSFEESACELYNEIACDERVTERKVKAVFARLAADERRHTGLVQEIIDLVNRAM